MLAAKPKFALTAGARVTSFPHEVVVCAIERNFDRPAKLNSTIPAYASSIIAVDNGTGPGEFDVHANSTVRIIDSRSVCTLATAAAIAEYKYRGTFPMLQGNVVIGIDNGDTRESSMAGHMAVGYGQSGS